MTHNSSSLHRKNALILGLALLGAVPFGWRAVASVGVGGGIQIVNLRALERSVAALLGLAERGKGIWVQLLLPVRLILMLAVVGFALLSGAVEPIPLVVGLSTTVPAVLWYGIERVRVESAGGV